MLNNITAMPDGNDPFAAYNTKESAILFPVAERRIGWEMRDGAYQRINTHKAIVRMVQGNRVQVLGVVGTGYKLVRNHELYKNVEDTLCKEIHIRDLQDVQVKDKVAGWGRMCFREYVFPSIKCRVGGGTRSDIAFRLLVQNGYGGSALRVHAGAIEFYCTNGMISGEYQSEYRKHTSGLIVNGVGKAVSNALETFAHNQVKWKRWAETPVKHQAAMDLLRRLATSDKLCEKLQQQYLREREERGGNLWAVYSALTYYASHSDGEFALRKTVEEQDTMASTMLLRELNVARWVERNEWKELETAC
jgi:hypothetical protein